MKMSITHDPELKFSKHARDRQEQRNITDSSVDAAIEYGEKIDWKSSTIYTDQNIKVVCSKDNDTVITVGKNTRNTRFVLSERTKQKEKSLLFKIDTEHNNHAMCELADLYLKGELGEKNIKKAYELFEWAAEKGNSHAMCKISQMYSNGVLGKPNQELADKWMRKAADRNNTYALAVTGQKLLGKYLEKYPVGSNIFRPSAPKKEILGYLNKAADKGNTRAIWHLSHIYENGLLGEKDLSKAIEFYVKAAKTGSPTSLESLHNMTLESKFSAQELEEILDNLSPLLTETSIGMAFQLGREQLYGNLGCNPMRGLKMIEQAALKQYDQAMLTLAWCYCDGIGCDTNLKLAQYWFLKLHDLYDVSAREGNVNSLWTLGHLYLDGNIDNNNLEKAESCLKEAIEKSSDPDWIFDLGMLYLKGTLGDKPTNVGLQLITQAIKIWQFQVENGITKGYFKLGNAYFLIHSHKNAVYWLSKSSNDDIESQLRLSRIYLDDSSPEKNISLGIQILEGIILNHGIPPEKAFEDVEFMIGDQTVSWLQDIAANITKPVSKKDSNQHAFQKFVLSTLANAYETGKSGKINYVLAAKCYYQLFVDFESQEAGNDLVSLYRSHHLPIAYYDTLKDWVIQTHTILGTDKIDYDIFVDCIVLLGKIYQNGDILHYDVKEAAKWLYLASYFQMSDRSSMKKNIMYSLSHLPNLNLNEKKQIVSELLQITQNIKINSPTNYKFMSRILGDIFYDNKIIDQNIDKAVYWYTESSLNNNSRASLAIAKIYQHDKHDMDTSIRWYKLSVQQGNKDALKELRAIVNDHHQDDLSSFLNSYQHQSVIEESKVNNMRPLKNLEFYPKTGQDMYELGKSYLNSDNKQDSDVLNAAFWFREAMDLENIDAAVELFSMYKSGVLGSSLIPVADTLRLDILIMSYGELKENIPLSKRETSSVIALLNNVSLILKNGVNSSSGELSQSIETAISQARDIDNKTLTDIISKLAVLIMELRSNVDNTLSNVLDSSLGDNPSSSSYPLI